MLKVLDLFSGIGGFSLGLEATEGFHTYAFVEIDAFCRAILKKHWPTVPIYDDIRKVKIQKNHFNVLCGGFPCQDISLAAQQNQKSILGNRSGLWFEYLRLINEGLPEWVIIENVENLRNKGLNIILWQLAQIGYDAEWHVIRACDVGLPHIRERIWIIANLNSNRIQGNPKIPLQGLREVPWGENGRRSANWLNGWNFITPPLLRSCNGIPNYMDRIKSLGNSVVPQIPYEIGMAILKSEGIT